MRKELRRKKRPQVAGVRQHEPLFFTLSYFLFSLSSLVVDLGRNGKRRSGVP